LSGGFVSANIEVSMGALQGKVAVITGSSRGLGLAIAQAYVREGAAVVLSARSQKTLDGAVQEITAAGGQAIGVPTDVTVPAQMEALADAARSAFGRFDIWVNNAGIGGPYGRTLDLSPEYFTNVVHTNIGGTYTGSLIAVRQFLGQGGGKLINLLGRGDDKPVAFQNAYSSSKAWVRWFTLSLAKEYKEYPGIGVYAFNPGLVDTDLLRKIDVIEGFESKVTPLSTVIRLWANPPSVPAEKAVWLASAATDSQTGLRVNILSRRKLFGGIFREAGRWITRRPAPDTSLTIHSVAPYQGNGVGEHRH
jgi:NAD(P)-dependent dehydrogenase (short-subunit alcohol dehydrogenase family)